MGAGDGRAAVAEVLDALGRGDRERLRLALHPYLRWTREDGTVLRGRGHVLDLLAGAPPPGPSASVELRDGQVYRWEQ